MTSKLFKALFSFKGLDSEGSLPFEQGSLLTVIQSVDQNWYFGCLNDAYGFIPIKYVEEVQDKDYNYMKMTINACIKRLQAIPDKKLTKDEHSALKKLLKHRDSLAAEMSEHRQKQQRQENKRLEQEQQQQQQSRSKRRPAPPLPSQATATPASSSPSSVAASAAASTGGAATTALARQLVDAVRASTAAPHVACVQAVRAVLAALEAAQASQQQQQQNNHQATTTVIGQVLHHLGGNDATTADYDETDGGSDLFDSPDWKALDKVLASADKRRRDWQERGGWSLHESEAAALAELAQLADLLVKADSRVSRRRLRADGCAAPLCLAELHAAERRPRVRAALRRCLATACAMDALVLEALLAHSSLPTDLMTEREVGLLPGALKLLAGMLVSGAAGGLRLPGPVVDALNERLFVRLFSLLGADDEAECSFNENHGDDENGNLAHAIVTFALAANSISYGQNSCSDGEATPAHERPLFRALLATRSAAQAFTETILLMFNRAEDPTGLFEHSPPRCDSVLKMLTDMFSHESTAELFYSNDIGVLVDVLCRELNNASPDSPRLPPLLVLLKQSGQTVACPDAFAKNGELRKALRQLSEQEDTAPDVVRKACKEILQLLFVNRAK